MLYAPPTHAQSIPAARTAIEQAQTALSEALRVLGPPTVSVAPGNLQLAIDTMAPGTTLVLEAGASYGPIVLRGGPGVIMSAGILPAAGERVTPQSAAALAKLVGPTGQSVVTTAAGAHRWTLVGLDISGDANDLVRFGNGTETALMELPFDLTIDRCYIHGSAVNGSKRGIALNSGAATVINSWVSDIKRRGQDTQAIAGWNGPGPYRIENNYLEASGENVIFGGSDPTLPDLVPSDILIRGNTLSKPVAWRTEGWLVKNLLELKNARRVTVVNNTMEHVWLHGQTGYAIVLTVRNQDGGCPWCVIEDVLIADNTIRHMGAGIQILGRDTGNPSAIMARVTFRGNVFEGINPEDGAGRQVYIGGGPEALTLDANRFSGTEPLNSALNFDHPEWTVPGLRVTGNTFQEGDYGIFGTGAPALGRAVLEMYAPGAVWSDNVILRGTSGRTITYPLGTILQDP